MAKKIELSIIDEANPSVSEIGYPVSSASLIYTNDGETVENKLEENNSKINNLNLDVESLNTSLDTIQTEVQDIKNNPSTSIDDTIESTEKVWSSIKTKEQISLIPKGDKGDKGDPGTASVSIDDSVTNVSQTWSSSKINTRTEVLNYISKTKAKSLNLFNKEDIKTGGYYDKTTGTWTVNTGYWSSEFIEVTYNTLYVLSSSSYGFSYYDTNKVYVSGASGGTSVTIPNNVNIKYVRIQFQNAVSKDTFMFAKNVLPSSYEAFYPQNEYLIPDNIKITFSEDAVEEKHIKNLSVTNEKINDIEASKINYVEKIMSYTGNWFDKSNYSVGWYNATGVYSPNAYYSTNKIKVNPGEQIYFYNCMTSTTFWSKEGVFITSSTVTNPIVPSDSRIYYMLVTFNPSNINKVVVSKEQLTVGSTGLDYGYTDIYKFNNTNFVCEVQENSISEDELTKEINQKFKDLESSKLANELKTRRAKCNLFIETYYEGCNQAMHPDVVALTTAISGYKYWMAYTPYPYGLTKEENPCIACSNDGVNWVTPTGLTNPIDKPDGNINFLSDTIIFYNEVSNILECWYRAVYLDNSISIMRKTSSDGITWGTREILLTRTDTNTGLVSPSVIRENGAYKIWVSSGGGGVYTSQTGSDWVKDGDILIDGVQLVINTHFNVKKNNNKYELIYADGKNLIYCNSDDGLNFTNKKTLITQGDIKAFDDGKYYRPAWMLIDSKYYFYYSYMDANWEWGTTLSIGTVNNDIFSITGIDANLKNKMAGFTRKPKYGGEKGVVLYDKTLGKMVYCEVGGKNAIWKDFSGNIVT